MAIEHQDRPSAVVAASHPQRALTVMVPRTVRPRRVASWLLGVVLLVAGGSLTFAPSAVAAATTVVSITLDDGVADQLSAADSLQRNGMRGTFYVVSGLIGSPGYFSRADLDRLAAAGNEIGGHTVLHQNAPTEGLGALNPFLQEFL